MTGSLHMRSRRPEEADAMALRKPARIQAFRWPAEMCGTTHPELVYFAQETERTDKTDTEHDDARSPNRGASLIPKTEEVLKGMVETIVQAVAPERIYLFGSAARGAATEDSDVDLLIVEREPFGPARSRRREMARLWRLLSPFRVPKDILVYSVSEIDRWKDAKNHVIAHAMKEGKLLYERS